MDKKTVLFSLTLVAAAGAPLLSASAIDFKAVVGSIITAAVAGKAFLTDPGDGSRHTYQNDKQGT